MGFMDKAKKMAEQAQAKLDEVQQSVNTSQGGQPAGGGPVVEYDKHGRPITPAPVVPDAGAPPAATPGVPPTAPAQTGPTPDPSCAAAERPASGHAGRARGHRADARPERPGSAPGRARCPAGRRPGVRPAPRGPQPPQHRAAEAVERGPARGLTERPPRLRDYGHAPV